MVTTIRGMLQDPLPGILVEQQAIIGYRAGAVAKNPGGFLFSQNVTLGIFHAFTEINADLHRNQQIEPAKVRISQAKWIKAARVSIDQQY